jgi:O-antigen/teichoic acid export membrane protein
VVRAIPVVAVSWVVVMILHHDTETRLAVVILTFGLLSDLVMRTIHSVFTGLERGELTATVVICQRFANAARGIAALAVGWGVLGVAGAYAVSSFAAFGVALTLLARRVGMPRPDFSLEHRADLRRSSLPFAAQDVFLALLDKLDTVILSIQATDVAVGRYGAAYRLLEATYFISAAMTASFSAMFTYLGHDTDPTVRAVYQRSLKLSLAVLVPCGVACGVLAEPLARAFFGADLASAAEPLRLLAPVIPLMGIVVLSISLVVSRGNPRTMAAIIFSAVAVNIALNVALIPLWNDRGAAAAMVLTYVIFLGLAVRLATRAVRGGVEWLPTVTGPLVAGVAMGLVAWALSSLLPVALVASAVIYFVVLFAIEKRTNPGEVEMVVRILSRRIPSCAGRSRV